VHPVWGAASMNSAQDKWDMVEFLLNEEADCVIFLCENPEPPPNQAIHCNGQWTFWNETRFEGDTVYECLQKAVKAKKEYVDNPPCLFCKATGKKQTLMIGGPPKISDCQFCKGTGKR
jgi:hypothetical protein